MSKDPKIYEKIYSSIALGIYGSQDIKKAIVCMLFGGSRKKLPDNIRLRDDINILLIRDPSTGQVSQTAPIGVYASGKGSSAADLTASISKDSSTGEFQIQGGALVLGGIVCIDQFDKMKPGDRVAIHEQKQTISVAKLGITTRLNSKTSVLAAVNSKFDSIFIVRDLNTNENNELHQGKTMISIQILNSLSRCQKNMQTMYMLKINFHLDYCMKPHKNFKIYMSQITKNLKNISQFQRIACLSQQGKLKQLLNLVNYIILLFQALAKMKLKYKVTTEQVDEAHRLFEVSTLKTIEGKEFIPIVDASKFIS